MHNKDEDLLRVGPGTVMGDFMRRYWIPALMSSEVVADGDPVRIMLLGEKLIAIRDSNGQVGVMDHRCPHRGASLFLGRNEQGGIRCVYHGWKFDVQGRCVDMPSVPEHQDFKHRVRPRAYKVQERNGMVWVYMGPPDCVPGFPQIEAAHRPESDYELVFLQRDCNWLQALEGDVDTSHLGFLHLGSLTADELAGHPLENGVTVRAPEYEVVDAPWGTSYGAYRKVSTPEGDRMYWRIANFLFPFWTQIPGGRFPEYLEARAWVPIDDEHTMTIWLRKKGHLQGSAVPLSDGRPIPGTKLEMEYLPTTTDWMGRWRARARSENDWLIDRDAQRRNLIYSGIDNIALQDQAITESMGPISDHSWEHLGPSDRMIARTRRRALMAARALRESGTSPPGTMDPEVFARARSGVFTAEPSLGFQQAYDERTAGLIGCQPLTVPTANTTSSSFKELP